jgi:cytochrome c oxidase subunit 3
MTRAGRGATPELKQPPVPGASTLGMTIFLVSLSVLFAASLLGLLVVRLRVERWVPEGLPPLPSGLWASTALILLSSGTIQWAVVAIRKGNQPGMLRGLLATTALGVGFLVLQTVNWWRMVAVDRVLATGSLYAFTFYVLTGLHALHVVGGLIPLGITTRRARAGAYSWAGYQGVRLTAMYWHFLDVVWVVLFAVLLLTS